MNKLKNALKDLGGRAASIKVKSNDYEEKIGCLQSRLTACEAERLERLTARMNIIESRADQIDREILDIVTEVKERKLRRGKRVNRCS